MMAAMAGGAITAPTAVPALTIPMAVERSRTGNHSAMTLVAAGNPPPSPAPSRNRLPASIQTLVARPWLAHASDQNTMITRKPRRVPSRSMSTPPPAYASAYANRKTELNAPNCVLVRGMSRWIAATATGSDWRSR